MKSKVNGARLQDNAAAGSRGNLAPGQGTPGKMSLATERCSMNATLRLLAVPALLTIPDENFDGSCRAGGPALEDV